MSLSGGDSTKREWVIRLLRERNIDVKVNGSLAKANVDDRMKIIELGDLWMPR